MNASECRKAAMLASAALVDCREGNEQKDYLAFACRMAQAQWEIAAQLAESNHRQARDMMHVLTARDLLELFEVRATANTGQSIRGCYVGCLANLRELARLTEQ